MFGNLYANGFKDRNRPISLILRHRLSLFVFAVLLFSMAYFGHSQPGWNVNSRYALTLAWAETGSPVLDNYVVRHELHTEDLAEFDGHFYSDKSIGTSLVGVPAALVVRGVQYATGWQPTHRVQLYLITLFSVGLLAAASGVLLMWWLAALSANSRGEDYNRDSLVPDATHAFVALGVMLGSLLYLYGTLFMSYLPAQFFLMAALLIGERRFGESHPDGKNLAMVFVAGLCGGASILCEYTYAAAAGLTGLYLIYCIARIYRLSGRSWQGPALSAAVVYGVGVFLSLLVFWIYTGSTFGELAIPYRFHINPQFRLYMSQGFMGAGTPSAVVLWLISFHPFRGLFAYSPQLALGFVGLCFALLRARTRPTALLCLSAVIFYFLFNSAYYMWWGGWSFSPRHLAPAIPFLTAGLLPWLQMRWGTILVILTSIFGGAIHTLVNATEPQTPDGGWQPALLHTSLADYDYPSIFLQEIWPRLQSSSFDSNLGIAAGLNGWASLLPLIGVWVFVAALIASRRLDPK